MKQKLEIKKDHPDAVIPARGYNDRDVGADLTVISYKQVRENVFLLDTGLIVVPPEGFYTEVHSRSSIYKSDFMICNKIGIIDPDYRGRLMIPVRYLGSGNAEEAVSEIMGTRFAQLILRRFEAFETVEVDSTSETQRGTGGFGSSGI